MQDPATGAGDKLTFVLLADWFREKNMAEQIIWFENLGMHQVDLVGGKNASLGEMISKLKPSDRGELEISDVNNMYIDRDQLEWSELEGWWTDAGTFPSLLRASNLDPDNFSTYFDLVWTFLDLDDEAAIERLRDVMVQRVEEDHLNIAWLDAMASMGEGNPGAALEHVAWIFEKMGRLPYVKSIEGYLHNHRGDAARARRSTLWRRKGAR